MAKRQYPLVEHHGANVVVTARSNVEAQQAATQALGSECTIIDVEKVHEGGIGGFFATELVRVTAKPSRLQAIDSEMAAVFASAEDLVTSLRTQAPHFADRLIEEWRHEAEAHAAAPAAPAAPAVVAVPVVAPVPATAPPSAIAPPVPATAPLTATPSPMAVPAPAIPFPAVPPTAGMAPAALPTSRWSAAALKAMGVPETLVDIAAVSRPETEGEWIVAIISTLSERCHRSTMVPQVMVGPTCANLARQLRMVSVGADELIDSVSSVALPNASVRDVVAGLNGRGVHLVVGGAWHHLGALQPLLVSAASSTDLLDAVRVAIAWDAGLGWYWNEDSYERIDEFAVMSHIRSILRAAERGVAS